MRVVTKVTAVLIAIFPVLLLPACQTPPGTHTFVRGSDLHNSIGVNVHQHFNGDANSHTNWSQVVAKLVDLGITRVRDGIYYNQTNAPQWSTSETADYGALAQNGIKLDLIVDPFANSATNCQGSDPVSRVNACVDFAANASFGSAISSFEWPNEYDHSGDPSWKNNLVTAGQAIYNRAHPLGYQVVGPSIVDANNRATLGNQSAYLDFGNLHDYQNTSPPSMSAIQNDMISNIQVSGSKPFQSTEFGWPVPDWANETDQARFTLRQYLIHLRLGIKTSYLYDLFDDGDSATNREDHYGVVHVTCSAGNCTGAANKAAATAIKNLLTLTPSNGPATLDTTDWFGFGDQGQYGQNDLSDLEYLDVELADGTHDLILWRSGSPTNTKTYSIGCGRTDSQGNHECLSWEYADPITDSTFTPSPYGPYVLFSLGADPLVLHITP
jgi:hypothetical protein